VAKPSLPNAALSKSAMPITATLTRVAVVGIGLALVVEQAGQNQTPVYWVGLLAPVIFLAAVWAASAALVRLDRGDAFGPAMVRALNEIGGSLMLGAFAAAVVQPSLIFLIGNGFLEMRGVRFNLDVENLTLTLVGLLLILLARKGQTLQSTLDEFV
jgi:hypothetical protein